MGPPNEKEYIFEICEIRPPIKQHKDKMIGRRWDTPNEKEYIEICEIKPRIKQQKATLETPEDVR